jgi:hypothetical protein
MNEGPGHVPLNKIPENMAKQLEWCVCVCEREREGKRERERGRHCLRVSQLRAKSSSCAALALYYPDAALHKALVAVVDGHRNAAQHSPCVRT